MRNSIILLCILSLIAACKVSPELTASENDTFFKMLGGALDEKAYDVQEANDGGFLVAGSINVPTQDPNISKEVAYLTKTDRFGNLQWQRKYASQAIRAIVKAPAGGWYLGADSLITLGGQQYLNFALFKIDEAGNVEWIRKFANNTRQEQVKSIMINPDRGFVYLIGDHRLDLASLNILMLIMVTDLQGNLIDQKEYGSVDPNAFVPLPGPNDVGNAIIDIDTEDKDYIFCGTTNKQGNKQADIRIAPFSADNNTPTADYEFGGNENEKGEQVIRTRDRGIAIIGTTRSAGTGGSDIFVMKLRIGREFPSGKWLTINTEWEKNFGGNTDDEGKSIFQADDGGYLVLGNLQTQTNGSDIYLIKLDFLGNVQWEKRFGGVRNDQARLVKQLANGDILILGTITFENNTMITLIRTDRNGNLVK